MVFKKKYSSERVGMAWLWVSASHVSEAFEHAGDKAENPFSKMSRHHSLNFKL
jgi:hypothetical protein